MKKLFRLLFLVIFLLSFTGCTANQSKETAFYVSLDGNDSWSGKLPEPNSKKSDGPFATFERARDAIRELKKAGSLPEDGITVNIRGGIYPFSKTFKLTVEDSGTESAPIIWRSYPGEEVRFIGGTVIKDFKSVDDTAVLKRFDAVYHKKILQTDLKAQGITNYGEIDPKTGRRMELFFNGQYMSIARYPDEGWLNIANVPQHGEKLINKGRLEWEIDGIPRGRHSGRFLYDGDRPKRWSEDNEIYTHGYYVYDWSDGYLKIKSINTKTREIYPEEPHHHYGYQKGARYYFLNILEELDAPGEFYIDRKQGILYFWPPEPITPGDVLFPTLEEFMVTLNETSYLTFQGIIFAGSRAGALKITGGSHNKIAGCVFRNLGNDAVVIEGGVQNGITGCDIYEVSGAGILLNGGDRKTLTPAGNYADNNHIHHFARVFKTYRPAINMRGVGNRITHCYIHDAPHAGILFGGNEHIIELNELTRIAQETGDVGAIYLYSDWTFCGNIIRHNYLHHIHGPVYLGCMTVYFDLPPSGNSIYGNIFYDLDRGFFTNNGRHNVIENNIFVKCDPSVQINVHPAPGQFELGGPWRLVEKLNDVDYKNPPYSTKYPFLLDIFEDGHPGMPRGNVVTRNVSYGGRWMDLHNKLDFEIVTVRDNLIADPVLLHWDKEQIKKGEREFVTYNFGDPQITDILQKNGNIVMEGDPGFVDVENEDFRLKEDSPAFKLGFKPIPFEKIGLYSDKYRKIFK